MSLGELSFGLITHHRDAENSEHAQRNHFTPSAFKYPSLIRQFFNLMFSR